VESRQIEVALEEAKKGSFPDRVDRISEWVGLLTSFLILPMTLIAALEVVLRYVFNSPTEWGWDVNTMLLGAFSILTGGYVLLKEGHVTVDIIVNRLSLKGRTVIGMITFALFFFCVVLLLYQSSIEAVDSVSIREKMSTVWSPPLYPLKILWPIGAFLLLLQGVANLKRMIDASRTKETEKP
jgi:TRAP-type mannitol/chloroaromatic compound transport system permease small subunit